uniref:Ribosomal protein S7 n=1 Tax=Babesia sp. Dunhuang TaxID=1164853 RepID=A0A411AD53_9APIC|nr:ribosomal protein S7 [Babesia sp. Dunhuang]
MKILNKEVLLNLFTKFIQKKGKYTKSKKLLLNISYKLRYMNILKYNFVLIIEYIIYKLNLPITTIKDKIHTFKYYFLIISLLKYIKKFIFIPFLKSIRKNKKLPFTYSFILEFINILKNNSQLIEYKKNTIDVFCDSNATAKTFKDKNFLNNKLTNNFVYANTKLKYIHRYNYNKKFINNIKFYNINIYNKYIKSINNINLNKKNNLQFI